MTLRNFKHISASSLKETTSILSKCKGKAVVIAGGTDLLGVLKDRIHTDSPEVVIDLKTIPNLRYINENKTYLRIGAMTTLSEITKNETIKEKYALLAEAARSVASPQIRNMGTLGGNICQEPRCWYYRTPDDMFHCMRKGGSKCSAILGENRYHSIFGGVRVGEPSCLLACPGKIEIPAYMSCVRRGDQRSAAQIILSHNPIPAITGRVCPHFCESKCNRSEYDEAVSIRNVERILGDYILDNVEDFFKQPKKQIKERVAIVGAGPAGLSAAYYLRNAGYQVTVYDKNQEAGGMLTYGIPAYRLPKEIIKKQIKAFETMGIKFKLNVTIGLKGTKLKDLRKKFRYVFLASGAWEQKTLNIENGELLSSGIDLLVSIGSGRRPVVGKRVLVIGGGNVAVDVAINARRLGAEQVMMVCLESRTSMPAYEEEIAAAINEGITILPSFGPSRIVKAKGRLTGMEFVKCTSIFDDAGYFSPNFDLSVKHFVQADQIFLAIGQSTDLSYAEGIVESRNGLIVIDEQTGGTRTEGVFAGGDVTSGPTSVIQSIAAGRKFAQAIAKVKKQSHMVFGRPLEMPIDSQEKSNRTKDISSPEDTISEATRCINCSCIAVSSSDLAPALIALGAKIKTTKRTINADDFFVADIMKCTVLTDNELVEEIEIPVPRKPNRQGYHKFRIRNAIDFPIVALAYSLQVDNQKIREAKIVFGAVAPIPLRVREVEKFLEGKVINVQNANAAGEIAVRNVQSLGKNQFKVQLVKALLKRSLI